MNITNITISNAHERGFAFAITEEGDQVFIPPHVAENHNLSAGIGLTAQLAINPNEAQRSNTRFVAIRLRPDEEVEAEASAIGTAALDEKALTVIRKLYLVSTAEIAEALGVDTRTAGNSANRLFNAGKIAKADVYGRVGQSRPSFILWADQASDFLEGN
jgi:hypothetical protein